MTVVGHIEDMGSDDFILNILVVPQCLGVQIIMVELGGNNREGDEVLYVSCKKFLHIQTLFYHIIYFLLQYYRSGKYTFIFLTSTYLLL